MKAEEIANRLVPIKDNSLLSKIDEAMNKGVKWGIIYAATDLSKLLTNSNDVDDIICSYRDIEAKTKELLQ